MRQRFEEYIFGLQEEIITSFERLDPNAPSFKRDSWVQPQSGKGISGIFSVPPPGDASPAPQTVLEKAGINVSVVHGILPPHIIKEIHEDHPSIPYDARTSLPFFSAAIDLVVHLRNPHAPTVHAGYNYFEIMEKVAEGEETGKVVAWWFGGASALTPSYLYEEDARHFHTTLQNVCNQHGTKLYPAFKKWCDEYFYIPHRQETRGIGGVFCDNLSTEKHARLSDDVERPRSKEDIFGFIQALGNSFISSYMPILERRMSMPSTNQQRRWQLLRRGRSVEFALLYDKGIKFGLMAPPERIDGMLMGLPETARWEYMTDMGSDPESEEGRLVAALKQPVDWVGLDK
ncbi:putative HEM13-coproporphyrinogen III oxidase [Rhizopogon vinicolor AM-OR11-026]|uniref:coproporphyrinogen oxidase n=1 Tax=Rhizopogon vinicolor AM-OR11-026 TaxID=1314800 RepID=A0A1B7MGI6_9AGAM|nr:putative HEM13-coproporphyrinogen III oxidase [Rhizopogon vinicolor AM-OR11-026]